MRFFSVGSFIATAFFFVTLALQWIVSWVLQVIFMILAYPFLSCEQLQDGCSYIFRVLSFFCTDCLNPFWRSHILRPFPKKDMEGKKVLVMMNHLSAADPFLMVRVLLPRDATWIAKDVLFRIPFGGWCLSNADDLRVYFKNKEKGFETVKGTVGVMMEHARRKLRRGRLLAVFPEGTRNKRPEGAILPFRLGFFTLAIEENATIVPVAISGTESCWSKGSFLIGGADAYFSCGSPVDASNFKTAEELRDYVWQSINELRESHPDRQGNIRS